MRATTTNRLVSDSYLDLVRAFPLRPIRSATELEHAAAILVQLAKSTPEEEMDAGQRDYCDALAVLIQQFERTQRDSILPKQTPVQRLKFLMQQASLTVNDLGHVIGSQPSASLILHGKRSMSKSQIMKLARYFEVSPALFMA